MQVDSADPRKFFLHYLQQLAGLVERGESYSESSRTRPDSMLDARLAPDMFPFSQQVSTAAEFALRALYPLADRDIPDLGSPSTYAQLREVVRHSHSLVQELPVDSLQDFSSKSIVTRAGFTNRKFSGWDYLHLYTIPNFLFHYSTAYAILRASGVPLGKRDFDGYHDYPPGFSFLEK